MKDLIAKHGLTDFAQGILGASKPCILGSTSDGPVGLAESKVGGLPHTPDTFQWPHFHDTPLEFIAQINCAETGSPDMPDHGLLLFFYDNRHGGYEIDDEGFISVMYYPDMQGLSERPSPEIRRPRLWGLLGYTVLPKTYRQARLTFQTGTSLPDLDRNLLSLPDERTEDAYCGIKGEMEETRFIQIGGFPNPVQTDDIEQSIAQLIGRGTPEDWIMILEIYEDKRTDMMWGDAGKLHFFCHADNLRNRDFSKCWMQTQCG